MMHEVIEEVLKSLNNEGILNGSSNDYSIPEEFQTYHVVNPIKARETCEKAAVFYEKFKKYLNRKDISETKFEVVDMKINKEYRPADLRLVLRTVVNRCFNSYREETEELIYDFINDELYDDVYSILHKELLYQIRRHNPDFTSKKELEIERRKKEKEEAKEAAKKARMIELQQAKKKDRVTSMQSIYDGLQEVDLSLPSLNLIIHKYVGLLETRGNIPSECLLLSIKNLSENLCTKKEQKITERFLKNEVLNEEELTWVISRTYKSIFAFSRFFSEDRNINYARENLLKLSLPKILIKECGERVEPKTMNEFKKVSSVLRECYGSAKKEYNREYYDKYSKNAVFKWYSLKY